MLFTGTSRKYSEIETKRNDGTEASRFAAVLIKRRVDSSPGHKSQAKEGRSGRYSQ